MRRATNTITPVAPHEGSVDRNFKWMFKTFVVPVGGVVNQNDLIPAPFPAPILNCISGLRCRPEMQFIFYKALRL